MSQPPLELPLWPAPSTVKVRPQTEFHSSCFRDFIVWTTLGGDVGVPWEDAKHLFEAEAAKMPVSDWQSSDLSTYLEPKA